MNELNGYVMILGVLLCDLQCGLRNVQGRDLYPRQIFLQRDGDTATSGTNIQ